MCLIVAGTTPLPKRAQSILIASLRMNGDGAGIAIYKGKWHVRTYLPQEYASFIKFVESEYHPVQPIIAHTRFATRGGRTRENIQPILLRDGSVLAHNGTLRELGNDKGLSDSRHLAQILEKLDEDERIAILSNLGGRFAYGARDGKIHTFNMFSVTPQLHISSYYYKLEEDDENKIGSNPENCARGLGRLWWRD